MVGIGVLCSIAGVVCMWLGWSMKVTVPVDPAVLGQKEIVNFGLLADREGFLICGGVLLLLGALSLLGNSVLDELGNITRWTCPCGQANIPKRLSRCPGCQAGRSTAEGPVFSQEAEGAREVHDV